jgi:uncharacterized protein YndB with AHSA1/START domain
MDIITKMEIKAPASTVFEAFVDPKEIGGFWFSSSSKRWETGKNIVLRYDEYDAEVEIKVKAVTPNDNIEFQWGGKTVTINFESYDDKTLVTTKESSFDSSEIERILGQKEGWVYMLSCLKAYIEHGVKIRAGLQ